jgi:hypothetical protein
MFRPKTIAALALLATATIAAASVDTSPKPGGVYRLKPGTYVQKDVDCGAAPNAAIRRYDGRGISGAHSRACRARVLSRRGNRFEVRQSCIGAGPAPRSSERQTVTISDALTFTLKTRGSGTTYRYCLAYMLPAGMRGAAR